MSRAAESGALAEPASSPIGSPTTDGYNSPFAAISGESLQTLL
jgi:hypothetical protein